MYSTGERFWSGETASYAREAGGKARRIRTRACTRVGDALIMTTSPDLFAPGAETEGFQRVKREARMTRYGGDCYAYCLLAAGFVDHLSKPVEPDRLYAAIARAAGR